MTNLFILLFLETILFSIAWIITKGDFFSVSIITIGVFIISTVLNIYANTLWDNPLFYSETLVVVAIGLSCIILCEIICVFLFKKKKTEYYYNRLTYINISTTKTIIITLIVVVLAFFYFANIKIISNRMGLSVFSAISSIKINYQDESVQMNTLVRQGYKVIFALAYVSMFIFINNCLILKRPFYKEYLHLIPGICHCFVCILSGGRIDILRFLSAGFIIYWVLLCERNQWRNKRIKNSVWKVLGKSIVIVFVSVFLLMQLREITKGNVSTNQLNSVLDYLAYYVGSPLQVLNIRIHNGITNYRLDYFGELTFRGIYNLISKLGFLKSYVPLNLGKYEYLIIHLGIGGNVDTCFGPVLIDFDILGMIIVISVEFSILMFFYYRYLYKSSSGYLRNKRLLIYSYCYYLVTLSFYENCMYNVLSFTGIVTLILLLLAYWFYFKLRINGIK